MLISFFSAAWLELEFPMGRLLSFPRVPSDFLLSCLVPHTPLLLSALYMDFFLQLVIDKDLQKLGDDLVKTPCCVEHEVA